jgi:DNA repair protein RadC
VSSTHDHAAGRVKHITVRSATTIDLVSLAISTRESDLSVAEQDARRLLKRLGNIRNLTELSVAELKEWSGFDDYQALRTLACVELGRRTANAGKGPIEEISGPSDIAMLLEYLADEKKEYFMSVLLDSKSHVLRVCQIHVGTVNSSLVGAREVFREAVREGAASVIVAHNHPSGDTTPSAEDIEITRHLVRVGEMLDIPVLDHVIIGYRGYTSLKTKGHI